MDTRDVALGILLDMETNNTFSNIALKKALRQNQFSDKSERAFLTRLAEGTTEYRITLDYVINQFSKTKVKKCKPLIRCLLRMGAYQIMYMDSVPDSAACNESVKLAKKHGFGTLAGFVNGVLRSIVRQKEQGGIAFPSEQDNPLEYLSIRYSMPEWLVKKLLFDYPGEGRAIIEAAFADRDTTIRVNSCKTDKEHLRQMLLANGINVRDGSYDESALIIGGYDFIRRVPGFKQGFFTVQDESSMCAVRAADIRPGYTVIDVCAAPGGKTTAAAEYLRGEGVVYSMDISGEKLALIEENVERLGFHNVQIRAHDATVPLTDIPQADVVISDLPCSGLGIIGRKNDIKYRLTSEQLTKLAVLQRRILDVVCNYVKPGGTLLYSTCTINPDENRLNVERFLSAHTEYRLTEDRLFLPGTDDCDGFYYAVLRNSDADESGTGESRWI